MPAGLHIVTKRRPGKSIIHYVYAWRGGPMIHRVEGGPKPRITAAISDAAAEARKAMRGSPSGDTLRGLVTAFKGSSEWGRLASTTKASWAVWLDRINEQFGDAPVPAFEDRRIRSDILEWRDRWADKPRSADMAIQALSRLLSWGVDRGRLIRNVAEGVSQLYEANRADVIWTDADFAAFREHAPAEIMEAVDLASLTGLRRGDLVKLPWAAIGDHAIIWRTSKSGGKATARIPLLPEAKALLARIKARHAAFMADQRPVRRKPLTETVLASSYWRPWTAMGFGSRFNDVKKAAGLSVHLHDLRGTFATRCMLAGLTDEQIADILGWAAKDVASIRSRYVDQTRVVIAIGERLARGAN